ncbi:MAG TPA: EamA family transporter [Gammaproteobacteria bacterium]|nr:EamA family transporter [Gammaproteobacteria bacterium]HRF44811.1 DMT family transporter [Candidatus Competibacteraceae bacterium]
MRKAKGFPHLDEPGILRVPDRIGLLFAVLAAAGFSFKAILVKLTYQYGVDAETLLALRMTFSLPFFMVMGWMSARRESTVLTLYDGAWLCGLGLFGYYLASYLDFLGLHYISAALERLILFVYPTLVVILSALFFGQPVTRRVLGALALCYAGIALAVAHDLRIAGLAQDIFIGSALVFGSALSYALYLLGNGVVVGRLGAVRVTAFASIVACLLAIGQFLLMRPISVLVQPWPVYTLALVMALFSTVLPVWLVSEAIRRLGAGPVAMTGSLGPVVTLLLAWFLLDEELGMTQLAGAALVITGVTVMARR